MKTVSSVMCQSVRVKTVTASLRANVASEAIPSRLLICAVICLFLSLLSGCAPQQSPEEIKSAVVDFDPPFKAVLEKKKQIDAQIETFKGEFRTKQGEINSKIMELEEELKAARKDIYIKTRELGAQLDPERQRINIKLDELKIKLSGKEARASSIKSSIKTQGNLLENKKIGLSQAEQAEIQDNVDKAKRELTPLEEEIAVLRREIQLYRQELNLLKY